MLMNDGVSTNPPSGAGGRIDRLMEDASGALAAMEYFRAAAISHRALQQARRAGDFERMARICLPLQEARRQVREEALDAGPVALLASHDDLPRPLRPGCYLVAPPLVAADGARIRETLWRRHVPAIVLTREPMTRAGQWPIVAAEDRIVVRARIAPPEGVQPAEGPTRDRMDGLPTPTWFARAAEVLGDAAIADLDENQPPAHRVADLLERLEAVPDHEKLHQRLEEACRAALREPPPSGRRRRPLIDDPFSF